MIPTLKRCENVVSAERIDFLGGRQNLFPDSKQHILGRQSSVLLHGLGCRSNAGGGGAVHWKYCDNDSTAVIGNCGLLFQWLTSNSIN